MSLEKIKISWEPTNIWNHEDFRQLIKGIKENDYCSKGFEYELWIITTNDNYNYVNAIAQQFEIPFGRVIMCLNDASKVAAIALNADIHFDGEQTIITDVNATTAVGILVDRKIDYPGMGLKYIKNLDTWTIAILRERNGEKTKPC